MGKLIDFDEAKKKYLLKNDFGMTFNKDLHKTIDSMSIIEAIPIRPKGHWIRKNSFLVPYKCSECNYESERYDNYCPNCGAKMESEE